MPVQIRNLDEWSFFRGDDPKASEVSYDDSLWEKIVLPHDFSVRQPFSGDCPASGGYLPGGTGWYRKRLVFPKELSQRRLLLNFDGVFSDAYVYVNGKLLGENHYGYIPFSFDISDCVVCDGAAGNVIAVKAVDKMRNCRWYSGSGIYRPVTLHVYEPVHIAWQGVSVKTPDIAGGKGTVKLSIRIGNESGKGCRVTLRNRVYSAAGTPVSAESEASSFVLPHESRLVETELFVEKPECWDPDHPVLYTVETELWKKQGFFSAAERTDACSTRFGFRWYSFHGSRGFELNGKAVKLNGVCMHHDQGALGAAAFPASICRQLKKIKEMGGNAVRTSHNPAAKEFISACNDLGLMVIEEAFDNWKYPKAENVNDFSCYFNTGLKRSNQIAGNRPGMTWSEFAVRAMVERDRNEPSVILWSICNEVQEGAGSDSTYGSIAENLIRTINELDGTRPVTAGDNQHTVTADSDVGKILKAISDADGVVGFNYASEDQLRAGFEKWGGIYAAEAASAVNSRGCYQSMADAQAVDGRFHLTSYDTSAVPWGCTARKALWDSLRNDYVSGQFVWSGWDYIGEPTPWLEQREGAVPNSSYFGIVDTAGFEKDSYYLYRAQWNRKSTTLHLVTSWDPENLFTENGFTPVDVYSNAPVIRLFCNGELIGEASGKENVTEAGHVFYTYKTAALADSCEAEKAENENSLVSRFKVRFVPGVIKAVAYEKDGITEITGTAGISERRTAGRPSKIRAEGQEIKRNGDTMELVLFSVTDAKDTEVTWAENEVKISVSGAAAILGVDNGDQATVEKFCQPAVLRSETEAVLKAFSGKGLVILKKKETDEKAVVRLESEGLQAAEVCL